MRVEWLSFCRIFLFFADFCRKTFENFWSWISLKLWRNKNLILKRQRFIFFNSLLYKNVRGQIKPVVAELFVSVVACCPVNLLKSCFLVKSLIRQTRKMLTDRRFGFGKCCEEGFGKWKQLFHMVAVKVPTSLIVQFLIKWVMFKKVFFNEEHSRPSKFCVGWL